MIGISDNGDHETELKVIRETERAFFLETENGEQVWMPQSAFDGGGTLMDWAERIFTENLENYQARERYGKRQRKSTYLKAHPELREAAHVRHELDGEMDAAMGRDKS